MKYNEKRTSSHYDTDGSVAKDKKVEIVKEEASFAVQLYQMTLSSILTFFSCVTIITVVTFCGIAILRMMSDTLPVRQPPTVQPQRTY
jgi:hypothetical protein